MLNTYSISDRIKQKTGIPKWLQHVIYWFLWCAFWALMWGTYDNDYIKTSYNQIIELPFKLALVYPVIYWLMPKYFAKSQYILFTISYLVLLVVVGVVTKYVTYITVDPFYFKEHLQNGPFKFTDLLNMILTLNTSVIIPFSVKVVEYWLQQQQKSSELEREKLQAELKFLRTQINPHFLFNALNGLYAMSLKNLAQTSDGIVQLADIMRYIIYEANESKIIIDKELQFLSNYIAFEKSRGLSEVDISFTVNNQRSGYIPPLLFIPLVENSFKHVKAFGSDNPWISIQFFADSEEIKLLVENSIGTEKINEQKGIGIENLKRRLEILFPDKHRLDITQTDYSFLTILKIFDRNE
ncbi:sensor histidine kinase [Mangrovimonas sp. DI 80]|uniref:sensor histidine kinase n=1 Tax=Mangrovimonas sp. DI 80 TaxID=1779330 RepID=UPI0015C56A42|nr:histidine kinase [Mangrovimonas sp. DI 80]